MDVVGRQEKKFWTRQARHAIPWPMDIDLVNLGAKMKAARGDLSRRAVSAAIGKTERTIARWEAGDGDPPVGALAKYAAACGVSLVSLVRGLS